MSARLRGCRARPSDPAPRSQTQCLELQRIYRATSAALSFNFAQAQPQDVQLSALAEALMKHEAELQAAEVRARACRAARTEHRARPLATHSVSTATRPLRAFVRAQAKFAGRADGYRELALFVFEDTIHVVRRPRGCSARRPPGPAAHVRSRRRR